MVPDRGRPCNRCQAHTYGRKRRHHVENVQLHITPTNVVDLRPVLHVSDMISRIHVLPAHRLTQNSFLCQAHYWTGYMALWLRSSTYSIELVNILPTFIDLIRALSSWLGTTLAGCLSLRGLWTFQASLVMFAIIVLTIWDVPDILKFIAFYCGGFSGMASPILYSWVNSTLKENYGERGLIISSMMTLGYCAQIWVPLFTFPTVEAPEYRHGYPACVAFELAMWGLLMFGAWFMTRWKKAHPDLEMRLAANESESEPQDDECGSNGDKRNDTETVRPVYIE